MTDRDRLARKSRKGIPLVPLATRFWAKVPSRPLMNACWPWAGSRSTNGYGQIEIDGRKRPAHRVAWELAFGPMDPALDACHSCDNPICVRPTHIFPGTPSDNAADAKRKGRLVQPWGPQPVCRNGHARTVENTIVYQSGVRECRTCMERRNRTRRWSGGRYVGLEVAL